MKYVLDASVALKWVLNESDSAKARSVRDDFKKRLHQLLAPDIFPVEVANTLNKAERRKILTPPEGSILFADVLSTSPTLHHSLPLLPRAIELSSQMMAGVYDCLYIALAEQEGCDLLTADEKLVQKFQTFPVVSLSSL